MRGRPTKKTMGNAAKKNRSAAIMNGGISRKPTFIGTNEKPSTATTNSVSARSRGVRCVFSAPPLQVDDAPCLQRLAQRQRDPRGLGGILQRQCGWAIVEHG